MPTLALSLEQVKELVSQLQPDQKREVLVALAEDTPARRQARMEFAEAQLRQACARRGLDWDHLTDAERLQFVDGLVHEGRVCNQ